MFAEVLSEAEDDVDDAMSASIPIDSPGFAPLFWPFPKNPCAPDPRLAPLFSHELLILTHELLSTVIFVSPRPERSSRHTYDQWPVALADNKMP